MKTNLVQREAERTYGIAHEDLTPSPNWTLYELRKGPKIGFPRFRSRRKAHGKVADRWFPSSKGCSGCGAVRAKLLLCERTYVCAACGLVKDRDENAADRLEQYGRQILSGSGSESNGRGTDRKTGLARQVAVKRQPGSTAPAVHETGTVPSQDGTAA